MIVSFIFFWSNAFQKKKQLSFECGFSTFSDAYGPFNIQYYFTATLFFSFWFRISFIYTLYAYNFRFRLFLIIFIYFFCNNFIYLYFFRKIKFSNK